MHGDRPRLAEGPVDGEVGSVHHPLRLGVLLPELAHQHRARALLGSPFPTTVSEMIRSAKAPTPRMSRVPMELLGEGATLWGGEHDISSELGDVALVHSVIAVLPSLAWGGGHGGAGIYSSGLTA